MTKRTTPDIDLRVTVYVDIAVPGPFFRAFTYLLPEEIDPSLLFRGQRVLIPFRRGKTIGFVHRLDSPQPKEALIQKIKPLIALIDHEAFLPDPLYALADWAMTYYLAPPGEVYRALFPSYAMKANDMKKVEKLVQHVHQRNNSRDITDRNRALHEAPLHMKDLHKHGAEHALDFPELHPLTSLQDELYRKLKTELLDGAFHPNLLCGVTGSGKTEVYLHLMRDALQCGGEALFLVPEIGLTPQLAGRVKRVFGDRVAVYHSQLTDKQRFVVWTQIMTGEKSIVIGTRSALFLPFRALKFIAVDEEHDPSYKQEEGFRYHARDLAMVRAQKTPCSILLGSATPSFESLHNAKSGKYGLFFLKERAKSSLMPTIRLVDLKRFRDKKGRTPIISEPLRVAIATHLARKHQVLLFLNRRGYSTLLFCNFCGNSLKCDHCSVSMTVHRKPEICVCHYCDRRMPVPTLCPTCEMPGLVKIGSGTEKLEKIVGDLFPHARLLRVDRDTLQSKANTAAFHEKMTQQEVDILIGTQVLAKGHDYPNIGLVGIINADLSLHFPDFRAEERTYQELTQVSGRAGRARVQGEVFVQTLNPEHPVFSHVVSGDQEAFFTAQAEERRRFKYPPFRYLVQIELRGKTESYVVRHARIIAERLRAFRMRQSEDHDLHHADIEIFGPAPATITRIREHYRYQIMIKGNHRRVLNDFFQANLALFEDAPQGVRILIDVDPYSLL